MLVQARLCLLPATMPITVKYLSMADTVSPEVRSRMMASIRGRDTKPEMIIRKALHATGFRYRLHDRKLPGRPDLVFPGRMPPVPVAGNAHGVLAGENHRQCGEGCGGSKAASQRWLACWHRMGVRPKG